MGRCRVIFWKDERGRVPLVDWLRDLPPGAMRKCLANIHLLEMHGHEMRRPRADYLTEKIYELRAVTEHGQFRILYTFVGASVVLLSHGFAKKSSRVPRAEIEKAVKRRESYLADPKLHVSEGGFS